MSRTVSIIGLVAFLFFGSLVTTSGATEYPRTYKLYIELGKEAIDAKNYTEAEKYFKFAQMVAPSADEPVSYLSLIKRLREGRVEPFEKGRSTDEVLGSFQKNPELKEIYASPEKEKPGPQAKESTPTRKVYETYSKSTELEPANKLDYAPAKQKKPVSGESSSKSIIQNEELLELDADLWSRQPNTMVNVALQSTLVFEGSNITRFLVITPGIVEASQVNRDQIRITPLKRGNTFLHVWDDTGRWTFRIEVVLPVSLTSTPDKVSTPEEEKVKYAKPFRFDYSTDWGSFYEGDSLDSAERTDVNFIQYFSLTGETPYGDFDTSAVVNKNEDQNEVSAFSVGIEDGSWGDFNKYKIRGFDVNRKFSVLTLPGQYVRGVVLESNNFDDLIQWSYIRGKSKESFGFISSGSGETLDAYIEGARLQLFPEENHKYAFNFARGFGEERSAFLKDHVYSIQTENRWEKWLLESELAYDEDELATVIDSSHRFENLLFNMSFRDINKDFTTIANRPSNRGEIGGLFELNFNQPTYNFSSTLDVYHNRVLPNPDREGAYNYDFNTAFDVTVNDRTRWGSNVYYVYTPGDLSSRRSFRVLTNLTRSFKLAEQKELSTFIGGAFQRNRVALAPTSDFERYSLSTGFSLPILTNLRYFTNYEYSWVQETESGDLLQPNVLNTGISYNKRIGEDIHTNVSFSYRNEEKTEGLNSFLAGEDSLEASVGVTYQPTEDFEVYLDGRFRNIWSEGIDNVAFNEYDIRSGARTSWELPFSWNPQGVIKGVVFKDKNDNKIFDEGEEGVPGAKIEVGNREYLTDDAGLYYVKVRAKRINVSVDLSSLKQKQILTTPAATVVNIEPRQMNIVNFGISTESGIYGVVFYDKNENGKPDADDEFIRQVEIVLDGKDAAMSGFEGDYFFKKVEPGKHTISIKIRTIPLEFLPAVKLKNEVEVAEGTTYVFHIPLRKR